MRLTDRPRTLREMKPDVAWPQDLEAVMVKALQRDSRERYQRAADFGRALAAAVAHMPDEMTAAEAGTMVLGAVSAPVVPPTMISGSAPGRGATAVVGAPGGGATRAIDAPPVGVTHPAPPHTPQRRKSVAPLVGGAALVVALLAGGAFFMRPDPAPLTVTPDTAKALTGNDTGPVASLTDSTKTAVPGPVASVPPVTPPNGTPVTRPDATPGTRSRFPARAELAELDRLTAFNEENKAAARSTMRRIDALLERPISGADSVEALLFRAQGYMLLEDQEGACNALREIRNDARNRVRSDQARNTHRELGCAS